MRSETASKARPDCGHAWKWLLDIAKNVPLDVGVEIWSEICYGCMTFLDRFSTAAPELKSINRVWSIGVDR